MQLEDIQLYIKIWNDYQLLLKILQVMYNQQAVDCRFGTAYVI